MAFKFYSYIQPTHYFSLRRKKNAFIFPVVSKLPQDVLAVLEKDTFFKSQLSVEYDLSWQAVQKGYIGEAPTYIHFESLPIEDEYRFVRKYFNPIWALYILFLRLCSFKNPVKELSGWWKSRNTQRNAYYKKPISYSHWNTFSSPLLAKAPLVSVIIPTLNRYVYLKDVIEDLEQQDYPNFEILIVDQTDAFQADFYRQFQKPLRVFRQEEKALWLARNFAIQQSKGDLYLLFDDDSRVEKDWISQHIKCLDFFEADISSGISISTVGAKVPENYQFFRISDQLDTGNVLIKREVFEKVGLFDRQFEKQRMGDGEFGLRSYLAGFLNISNPYAQRLHLKVSTGGLRQMGSWDGFRPKNWLAPRPIPSVLYFFRKYYGKKRTILALFKMIPPSLIPYRFKKNKLLLSLGLVGVLLFFPLVLVQILTSWRMASKKLREGGRISPYE